MRHATIRNRALLLLLSAALVACTAGEIPPEQLTYDPTLRPYVDFLSQGHPTPVNYVLDLFDDNDIVIPSKQVSRYHAELRVRAGRVHIWDLQARNLTYVNGEAVKNCELKAGVMITIGDAELRYDG